jgi:hypothetical protein
MGHRCAPARGALPEGGRPSGTFQEGDQASMYGQPLGCWQQRPQSLQNKTGASRPGLTVQRYTVPQP